MVCVILINLMYGDSITEAEVHFDKPQLKGVSNTPTEQVDKRAGGKRYHFTQFIFFTNAE